MILYTLLAPWSSLQLIDIVAAAVTICVSAHAAKLFGIERQRVAWVYEVLLGFC